MKRNFFEDGEAAKDGLSYMDGFRFGFGMFIAWALGTLVLSALCYGVFALLKLGS